MEKVLVEDLKKGDVIKPFRNSREEPTAGKIEITLSSDGKNPGGAFEDIFLIFDTQDYIIDGDFTENSVLLRIGEKIKKIN